VLREGQRGRVKIGWTAPRGKLAKYSLKVKLMNQPKPVDWPDSGRAGLRIAQSPEQKRLLKKDEIWLPKEAVEHVTENLDPGELYQVSLHSMTSDTQKCLKANVPKKFFLTTPLPPGALQVGGITTYVAPQCRCRRVLADPWSRGAPRPHPATPASPATSSRLWHYSSALTVPGDTEGRDQAAAGEEPPQGRGAAPAGSV
jgi:hypothetical protein